MTEEQKAAYVNSKVACALIEAMGMLSENLWRLKIGDTAVYSESSFSALIDRYGIGSNSVIQDLTQ
jgi:hypothetical protein